MKMSVFSVLDAKTRAFMMPFYSHTIASALRTFSDATKDPASLMHQHPSDFQLWLIGEFDDQTGEITPQIPQSLGSAVDHVKPVVLDTPIEQFIGEQANARS